MKLVLVVLSTLALAGAAHGAPPPGLTDYGKIVWNLDALLHDIYGKRAVCMISRDALFTGVNYAPSNCRGRSLAEFSNHRVVFRNARRSAYRVSPVAYQDFERYVRRAGNIAGFVTVHGTWQEAGGAGALEDTVYMVSCGRGKSLALMRYGLDCVAR